MAAISRPFAIALDCCRWMAALLVVLQHLRHGLVVHFSELQHKTALLKAFYFVTGLGNSAVIVFFVLSGVLVGGGAAAKFREGQYLAGDYALHRVSRIYTVLIPALVVGGIFDGIGLAYFNDLQLYTTSTHHGFGADSRIVADNLNLSAFIGNILMVQTWFVPVFGSNGPLWSLACEWWYYVLFWLCLGTASPDRSLAARCVLGLAAAMLTAIAPVQISLWFAIWLLGVAFAQFQAMLPRIPPIAGMLVFGTSLVGVRLTDVAISAHQAIPIPAQFGKDMIVALGFCVLLASLRNIRRFSFGPARLHHTLASFSYTTYLVHFPAMVLLTALAHDWIGLPAARQPSLSVALQFVVMLTLLYFYSYAFASLTESRTNQVREALRRLTATRLRPE